MKLHLHIGHSEPDDILIDLKMIGCNFIETSREIDLDVANSELYGEVPDFKEFIKTLNASFTLTYPESMNIPSSLEVIFDLDGNELWRNNF